jgi:tetratricopeptide (TPR) repeat protein
LAEAHPEFAAAAAACLNQLTTLRRLDAVRDLMNLIPAATIAEFSPEVQFAFGQGYMAVKEYSKATGMFKLIGRRPAAMNLLGYAEALSGNCDAAKTALEEYASAPGEEANGFDSLGETSYFCGRFKAAEQYFEQSAGKWKNERDQIEPVKAAAMRLLSGDAKGAEQIAATHFRKIGKGDPRAVAALEPVWKAIAGAATDQERRAKIEATLIHRP